MCVLPYTYRNILEMLLKLTKLCEPMGGRPLDLTKTIVTEGTPSGITFSLGKEAPTTLFIKPSTGNIFGKFTTNGTVEFTVVAHDAGHAHEVYHTYV